MSDRTWFGHGPGFDVNAEMLHKAARQAHRNQDVRGEIDKTLEEMISDIHAHLASVGSTAPSGNANTHGEDQGLPDQTRKIVISAGQQLDVAGLTKLNELFAAEGQIVNKTQELVMPDVMRAGRGGPAEEGTAGALSSLSEARPMHQFKALQENIHGQTDQATRRNATMAPPAPAAIHSAFTARGTRVLELFFGECRTPNDAEMFMLAEYLQVEIWTILDWFKAKTGQTEAYHLILVDKFSSHPELRAAMWTQVQAAMVRQQKDLDFAAYCRKRRQMTRGQLQTIQQQKIAQDTLELMMEVDGMD